MPKGQQLISANEAMKIVGWKNRSSLTKAVQSGALAVALSTGGVTSAQFFDRAEVERYAKERAA